MELNPYSFLYYINKVETLIICIKGEFNEFIRSKESIERCRI